MSNAARRVLDLFLQASKRGVTDVTGVTRLAVTPENPIITPVTPVTYRKQHSRDEGVTGVTAAPRTEGVVSEDRIVKWLDRNPAPSPAGRCAWCGEPETNTAAVVPFGTEPGSHAWVHSECWRPWQAARRAEAVEALTRVGIVANATEAST